MAAGLCPRLRGLPPGKNRTAVRTLLILIHTNAKKRHNVEPARRDALRCGDRHRVEPVWSNRRAGVARRRASHQDGQEERRVRRGSPWCTSTFQIGRTGATSGIHRWQRWQEAGDTPADCADVRAGRSAFDKGAEFGAASQCQKAGGLPGQKAGAGAHSFCTRPGRQEERDARADR